ncbi:uncharacterized protein LOC131994834 [Stomoxys calcitrans]|uniref:uncharacterized protein LOC131994834 n=1 Tax=Stomoxys calcitrans TaxID=35570 RepID=UPI0027E2934A|nr:uncharacterized protein LOC131994834 [Stomoxys calcitrans]
MRNIKCETFDPEYAVFGSCELAPNLENSPTLSIVIRLLKIPLTNLNLRITVGLAGPQALTVVNSTFDICAFLKSRKSNKAVGRLYQYIAPYTNLNHRCPYKHDIHIQNLSLTQNESFLSMIHGEIVTQIEAIVDGKKRVTIEIRSGY